MLKNPEIHQEFCFTRKEKGMVEREADLKKYPSIKKIYEEYLDNSKHHFPINKFVRRNYPDILKKWIIIVR